MIDWPAFRDSGKLKRLLDGETDIVRYWQNIFDGTSSGQIDTWDYQWLFSCWANDGLTCLPERNLVRNIGFGADATRTTDANNWLANLPAEEIEFPLRHPRKVIRHVAADKYTDNVCFGIESRSRLEKSMTRLKRGLPVSLKRLRALGGRRRAID